MGDFNIDMSKPSNDRDKLNRLAARYGLTQLIKTSTRVMNTTRSTIDLIFTNNEEYYVQTGVTDLGVSDHCLTYTSRRRLKLKNKTNYYIGRSYRNFDPVLFYTDIAKETWIDIYAMQDPNEAAIRFTNTLLTIAEIHAPHRRLKCRENQPKWVTAKFLSMVDEKHHWCNIYKRRPTQFNAARKREATQRVNRMKRALKKKLQHRAIIRMQRRLKAYLENS